MFLKGLSSKDESASWKHERIIWEYESCTTFLLGHYTLFCYLSAQWKSVDGKSLMEHPFAIKWHCRNAPRAAPSLFFDKRLCAIKDNQCPLIYVCDANRNGNKKMVLIVLLKKDFKTNDISPGEFITYLLLSRPGTTLQVDIRSWSLFAFLKMLYHWKCVVFVSTKNQLYCYFL